MFRSNVHSVNIHAILEPTLFLTNLDVVSTHLSLLHQAVLVKSPILESIASPPLTIIVMKFIPKLHGDLKGGLEKRKQKGHEKPNIRARHSVNQN